MKRKKEIPENHLMQINIAVERFKNLEAKKYPNTKKLNIPMVDYRYVFEKSADFIVWYVYNLETNEIE